MQGDELAKAKGVPMEWMMQDLLTVRAIHRLTDLHIWVAVASSLSSEQAVAPAEQSQLWTEANLGTTFKLTKEQQADLETWEWSPPDLRPGGE